MDLQTRIISLCNIRCRFDEVQLGKYGHVNPINSALTGIVLSSSWNLNYHHRIFVNVLFLRWYCNAFAKSANVMTNQRYIRVLKDRYLNNFHHFYKCIILVPKSSWNLFSNGQMFIYTLIIKIKPQEEK